MPISAGLYLAEFHELSELQRLSQIRIYIMYNTSLAFVNCVTVPFLQKGFANKRAFINVVNSIDFSIDDWDLEFAWDYGICTMALNYKIGAVLETLKNE